jgi:hypothetical protein
MRPVCLAAIFLCSLAAAACGETGAFTAPSPPGVPAPVPVPGPFPSINVGEPVRFQFTRDDYACVGGNGRCKSFNVTPGSGGQLDVVLRSISGDASFTRDTEMYVVPGADSWRVSGAQLTATLPAAAGTTYEIRMYSPVVPSIELELLVSVR